MNIKKIKELIELMNDNDLSEIEIEHEGVKIKLIKKGQGAIEQVITPVISGRGTVQPLPAEQAAVSESKSSQKEVKAPMVGTFYRAPSPDSDSFVEAGDIFQKGDVLCIVEAMKLMNEVKAEFGGRIVEVLVENAEAVEFGQAMFLVEPS